MKKIEIIEKIDEELNISTQAAKVPFTSTEENWQNYGFINGIKFVRSLVDKIDEPGENKRVVPESFDNWYQEIKAEWGDVRGAAKSFALWKINQFGFGSSFEDAHHTLVTNEKLRAWVLQNQQTATEAILYGYTIEVKELWLVKLSEQTYFKSFKTVKEKARLDTEKYGAVAGDKAAAFLFEEQSKAAAVALLTDGIVEKVVS